MLCPLFADSLSVGIDYVHIIIDGALRKEIPRKSQAFGEFLYPI